jgi:hypothetical protein
MARKHILVILELPNGRRFRVARFPFTGSQCIGYTLWLLDKAEQLHRIAKKYPEATLNTEGFV